MSIKKGSIVTLSDHRKYLVVSRISYRDHFFLYLVEVDHSTNIKFACEELEGDRLMVTPVSDENLIQCLLPLFDKDVEALL